LFIVQLYTDKVIFSFNVAEFTPHIFGIFFQAVIICDCIFVSLSVNHQVISSAVIILGVGTMSVAVFINTPLYCQSILGILVVFAAFV
jgi:hypothetical protein